jgi:hypothetical protein
VWRLRDIHFVTEVVRLDASVTVRSGMKPLFVVIVIALCVSMAQADPSTVPTATASQAAMQDVLAGATRTPAKKTKADLDAQAKRLLAKYQAGKTWSGKLETLEPITIAAAHGVCYAVLLRLGDDASWDSGVGAATVFDLKMPSGPSGYAGPGVIGPGALGMTTCADSDGRITMKLRSSGKAVGHGPFTAQLYSHKQTADEARANADDQREQDARYQKSKAEQAAKLNAVCDRCAMRYQGCLGAGRSDASCRDDYRHCTFDGGDYSGACHGP